MEFGFFYSRSVLSKFILILWSLSRVPSTGTPGSLSSLHNPGVSPGDPRSEHQGSSCHVLFLAHSSSLSVEFLSVPLRPSRGCSTEIHTNQKLTLQLKNPEKREASDRLSGCGAAPRRPRNFVICSHLLHFPKVTLPLSIVQNDICELIIN